MPRGYLKEAVDVGALSYCLVWHTKYRKKVLVGAVAADLKAAVGAALDEIGCRLEHIAVAPDSVTARVSSTPRLSPNTMVNRVKADTSRVLRGKYPSLRSRMPSLWSRAYFVNTCGTPLRAREYAERGGGYI